MEKKLAKDIYISVCSPLDQPNNGTITLSDGKGLFGSIATYTCFEGFELSGDDSTRACKADGQWSGAALTCEEISMSDFLFFSQKSVLLTIIS